MFWCEGPRPRPLGPLVLLWLGLNITLSSVASQETPSSPQRAKKPGQACRATLFPEGNPLMLPDSLTASDAPEPTVMIPVAHPAFTVKSSQFVPEYNFFAVEYVHVTGATVWSLSTAPAEREMTFSICFRTPVTDSYGAPHVLEHSVLQGSLKYPVQSVFSHLKRRSLQTYINASTWPDRTCYPVASLNAKDLYNLAGVYMDVVFAPLAVRDPSILAQEGWRYELKPKDKEQEGVDCTLTPDVCELRYTGAVFPEMKGVWGIPDAAEWKYRLRFLFPDMPTYKYSSGGVPSVIPQLTFEHLKAFHERHYTPTNAWITFYGPDDVGTRLRFVDDCFQELHKQGNIYPTRQSFILPQIAFPGEPPGNRTPSSSLGWTYMQFFALMCLAGSTPASECVHRALFSVRLLREQQCLCLRVNCRGKVRGAAVRLLILSLDGHRDDQLGIEPVRCGGGLRGLGRHPTGRLAGALAPSHRHQDKSPLQGSRG